MAKRPSIKFQKFFMANILKYKCHYVINLLFFYVNATLIKAHAGALTIDT